MELYLLLLLCGVLACSAGETAIVYHSANTFNSLDTLAGASAVDDPLPNDPIAFDFWLLAQFNPPAFVPVPAHSRTKHAITRHEAFAGFWTHGLWPIRYTSCCRSCSWVVPCISGLTPSTAFPTCLERSWASTNVVLLVICRLVLPMTDHMNGGTGPM